MFGANLQGIFTVRHMLIGLTAAFILGLSKTAVPGGGLLATPLFAMIFQGRLIAGSMIPVLVLADIFAFIWYSRHARKELLKPLIVPVLCGFVAGSIYYAKIGSGGRNLQIVLGSIILVMVIIQSKRLFLAAPPSHPTPSTTRTVGSVGGFTTFVANAAGPVLNTYFSGIGLSKSDLIGTSAVFYFVVNLSKVPAYLAIGQFTRGGQFFSQNSILFDAMIAPAVVAGVFGGRWLLPRISQKKFTMIVLVLAAFAAIKLLANL